MKGDLPGWTSSSDWPTLLSHQESRKKASQQHTGLQSQVLTFMEGINRCCFLGSEEIGLLSYYLS